MKIKIADKRIYYACLQLFLLLIEMIISTRIDRYEFEHKCHVLAVFVIVNLVTQVIGLYRIKRLFSIGGLLIILSYLVNCSYIILFSGNLFVSDSAFYSVFLRLFSMSSFCDATQYALVGIAFMYIGYILLVKRSMYERKPVIGKYNLKLIKQYGITLALIFGGIYLLQMIISITGSISVGTYHVQSELGGNNFIRLARNLESFFLEGAFVLMIYYKLKSNFDRSKIVLAITVIMLGLYCLTGVRSRPIMLLLILMILWVKDIAVRIKGRNFILLFIGGLFILQFLMSIRETRGIGYSFNNIINSFLSLDNNIFYETLNEFGASIFVTAGFMEGNYSGKAWELIVREIVGILPSVSRWGGDLFLTATIRSGFEEMYSLGSTYIAESYYYFGTIGQFLIIFFGIWICMIDNYIDRLRKEGRYLSIAIAIPGMVNVLNSTRANLCLGLKMFLYSWLIYVIISMMLGRGKVKLNI